MQNQKYQKKQLHLSYDEERLKKLSGMFLIYLAFYLFVAFTSYLFTWQNDHDIVFRFSWEIFLTDIQVNNWLGRLGAFLADLIVYWGFGIFSIWIIYILYKAGLLLIRGESIQRFFPFMQKILISFVVGGPLLAFIFQKFNFPLGGALSEIIVSLLENTLGNYITGIVLFSANISCLYIFIIRPSNLFKNPLA